MQLLSFALITIFVKQITVVRRSCSFNLSEMSCHSSSVSAFRTGIFPKNNKRKPNLACLPSSTMTLADDPISLKNKLQTMETFFTDFMIDTIERFQGLTEAKVFLLVENSGEDPKRRYCGAHEFVQRYETNGLLHRFADSAANNPSATAPIRSDRTRRRRVDSEFVNGIALWSTCEVDSDIVPEVVTEVVTEVFPEYVPAKKLKLEDGGTQPGGTNMPTMSPPNPSPTSSSGEVPTLSDVTVVKEEFDETAIFDNEIEVGDLTRLNCSSIIHTSNLGYSSFGSYRSNFEEDDAEVFFSAMPDPHQEAMSLAAILSIGGVQIWEDCATFFARHCT